MVRFGFSSLPDWISCQRVLAVSMRVPHPEALSLAECSGWQRWATATTSSLVSPWITAVGITQTPSENSASTIAQTDSSLLSLNRFLRASACLGLTMKPKLMVSVVCRPEGLILPGIREVKPVPHKGKSACCPHDAGGTHPVHRNLCHLGYIALVNTSLPLISKPSYDLGPPRSPRRPWWCLCLQEAWAPLDQRRLDLRKCHKVSRLPSSRSTS